MLFRLPPVTFCIMASMALHTHHASSNIAMKAGDQSHCISWTTPSASFSISPLAHGMQCGGRQKYPSTSSSLTTATRSASLSTSSGGGGWSCPPPTPPTVSCGQTRRQ